MINQLKIAKHKSIFIGNIWSFFKTNANAINKLQCLSRGNHNKMPKKVSDKNDKILATKWTIIAGRRAAVAPLGRCQAGHRLHRLPSTGSYTIS